MLRTVVSCECGSRISRLFRWRCCRRRARQLSTARRSKTRAASKAPTVDISELDVGPYPTKPSQPLGVAGDPSRGALIEAQRMSDNVDRPVGGRRSFDEFDRRRDRAAEPRRPGEGSTRNRSRPPPVGTTSSTASPPRAAADNKSLVNAVLRFADAAAAAAAATEFGDIAAKTGEGVQPHADTRPSRYARDDLHRTPRLQAMDRGARIHCPRPLCVHATRPCRSTGWTRQSALVAKTIDLQGPAIDQFRATDPSEFADISLDPTGLLARTLPVPDKEATPHPEHHATNNAVRCTSRAIRRASATLFADIRNGSCGDGEDERLPDQGRRGRAATSSTGSSPSCRPTSQPAKPVNNLPDSRCCNWRTRPSTVSARRTATRSKPSARHAVGCPAAGRRPVRHAAERLSQTARPAAPARSAPWPRCLRP